MPRVKIDYVVSFSSEDSENPASNLLLWDISKRKWLCSKGEPSCSVVLQLSKAVQIQSIHIGAHHTSLVEVLVGLSEKPNDPFEVLVPSCVFVSASESRREERVERVRTFAGEQLTNARLRRWDRLRVVCSQPYNKHCKYGLSFIHVFSPEADCPKPTAEGQMSMTSTLSSVPSAVPSRMFTFDTGSSDEEEFKPGELFAKHLASADTTATDAQIRQASSNALKNISDSSTKLTKTPISKRSEPPKRCARASPDMGTEHSQRQRDNLLYTDDEERPHKRIDHLLQKHKDEREKERDNNNTKERKRNSLDEKRESSSNSKRKTNETKDANKNDHTRESTSNPGKRKRDSLNESKRNESFKIKREKSDDRTESSKRKKIDDNEDLTAGPVCRELSAVLRGVVFALSGYVNPQRAALRDTALRLGAQYRPDYTPQCTHLICAFPNTPKLRAVRAAGGACVCVRGEWLEQCERARRRLPWECFATEPHRRRDPPPDGWPDGPDRPGATDGSGRPGATDGSGRPGATDRPDTHDRRDAPDARPAQTVDSDLDTEDEIEEVRAQQAQRSECDSDSDVTEPESESRAPHDDVILHDKMLDNFLEGYTCVVSPALPAPLRARLERYLRAYGALVIPAEAVDGDSEVHYVVCCARAQPPPGPALRVRPAWVWRAHAQRTRPADRALEVP